MHRPPPVLRREVSPARWARVPGAEASRGDAAPRHPGGGGAPDAAGHGRGRLPDGSSLAGLNEPRRGHGAPPAGQDGEGRCVHPGEGAGDADSQQGEGDEGEEAHLRLQPRRCRAHAGVRGVHGRVPRHMRWPGGGEARRRGGVGLPQLRRARRRRAFRRGGGGWRRGCRGLGKGAHAGERAAQSHGAEHRAPAEHTTSPPRPC
mmetsp:Transcript_21109/g.66855  ORF Transcript_21109/g.66855 Transcript_21109/m.66855 type:complete len:204 (+) Transcript_21109:291-902(+)